ncbi:MAG: primosomal protein N', partial [Burkholderiaceae bacterium]
MSSPTTLQVAVDAPLHSGLSGLLDYTCERPLPPGTLVRVPLGKRDVPGVVWHSTPPIESSEPSPRHTIRPITA